MAKEEDGGQGAHRRSRRERATFAKARPVSYQRERDLPRLIPLWPAEISDGSIAARDRLVRKMARALRAERQRGLAGHWAYDLARHAALYRAYQAEKAALADMMRKGR